MAEIEITYYGHSCFQISYEGYSVVIDPYEDQSVPGLKLPEDIHASEVYCTHDHHDHDAAELIHTTGIQPFPFFRAQVPHDECGGAKRGFTDMIFFKVGSVTIVHLGDIGREPSEEEYEALQKADVLMVPAGGYYTIDAAMAAKIIAKVHAGLNILMHYRRGSVGYSELADLSEIASHLNGLKNLNETFIKFDEKEVPAEIITLKPLQ